MKTYKQIDEQFIRIGIDGLKPDLMTHMTRSPWAHISNGLWYELKVKLHKPIERVLEDVLSDFSDEG